MEKLDLESINGALTSKDNGDILLAINLLSTQNLTRMYNESEISRLVSILLKVPNKYCEERIVEQTDYLGNPIKTKRTEYIFKGMVGTGRFTNGYLYQPNMKYQVRKDRKFQKMSPYKKASFLLSKMMWIWRQANDIPENGSTD